MGLTMIFNPCVFHGTGSGHHRFPGDLANYTPPVYHIEKESFEFTTQIRHPQSAELGPIRIEYSADLLNWSQADVDTETVSLEGGIVDIKATIITSNFSAGFLRLQTGN